MEPIEGNAEKEYRIEDDKGPKQLIIRNKAGTFMAEAYGSKLRQVWGPSSSMIQSQNGNLLVITTENELAVLATTDGKQLYHEKFAYINHISFSPNGKYLQLLHKADGDSGKTVIFELKKMAKVQQFVETIHSNYYNQNSYPLVRFTSDDLAYFRYNNKQLEFYLDHELQRTIKTGSLQLFEISSISTNKKYFVVGVFLDKKENSGNLVIYTEQSDQPFYQKIIKKAEQIRFKFSPSSHQFLMELQIFHDPTGKSYYGQNGLCIFNEEFKKISKIQTQGPIHDFGWDKKGQFFIVISGFMPANSVLFTQNNQLAFEFGKHHKNTIIWGNLGRFVCLAGFGNLTGEMEIWDLKTKKAVGFCKSNSASYCQWSPDDRKIMTCTVTPRLRVDNCYKIFSYTGVQLHKQKFDQTQLYEVTWAKVACPFEPRGVSPGRKIEVQEKKDSKKFQSFSSLIANQPLPTYNNAQEKLVPGQFPDEKPKKKKKRIKHKKEEPNLQP